MWSIHWHTHLARFAEIWIASLASTFLVGYQFASRRRTASQVLGARRSLPSPWFARGRSFPPGDRPPLLRAVGQRRWIGWAWGTLNRREWEAQSLSARRMEI